MDTVATTSVFVSIVAVVFFAFFLRFRRSANHCPYPDLVLGNLLPFLRNRHRFLDWAADLLAAAPTGTIEVRGPLALSRGVATARPPVVDHLLRSAFPNYVKGDRTRAAFSDLLGRGIFNADGRLWSLQRKVASREFTTRFLRSFTAEVVRSQLRGRLLPLLSSAADEGRSLDLQDVLRRFAFDNICAVSFGTDPCSSLDPSHHDRTFFAAFDEAVAISSARMFAPVPWVWKLKRALNVGSERRLRDAIKTVDEYALKIVASKASDQDKTKQDLLSRFMAAMDEDGSELSSLLDDDPSEKRRFLRDIVLSFVLAGKDSTSSGLTWFFWLLSANPMCVERIVAEISELKAEEEEQVLGYDELKSSHYLHAAITESLRLYPPVPIDTRVAAADDVLPDGTRVKAGWFADYSAYAMARLEDVWGDDCREFKPERWLDGKGEFVSADASKFPVFHAGPRMCLGKEMAYAQMKAVAAAVLRRFEVEALVGVGPGAVAPPYEMAVNLRMKGGLPVRLRRRRGT